MGVNLIKFGGRTLIDLTNDSIAADYLLSGETAHGADGEPIIGTNPYEKNATDAEVEEQARLIGLIASALEGKAGNGGGGINPTGTVTFTENGGPHDVKGVAYVVIDVTAGTPETWTFTLENGNTVEKEVYVE
jgi:hypothetical protein